MAQLVVGQQEAVDAALDALAVQACGMQAAGRPLANILFLGPTGTGKTHLVESLARVMVGSPAAVVKIDCAEFQHSHEIAKLIGSPPGYLGHRETHPLLSQVRLSQYYTDRVKISFVLFDEIEKASDALWNLLLGIMDRATLTLGDNSKVDFSNSMIFMTSNLGSKEIQSALAPSLGFAPASATSGDAGLSAARKRFTPEFINRLDRIVTFLPLGAEQLSTICDLELSAVQDRIMAASAADMKNPRFLLDVSDEARAHLIAAGTDTRYGARHLKRTIEREVVRPLVGLLGSKQVQDGDTLHVSCEAGVLHFYREALA